MNTLPQPAPAARAMPDAYMVRLPTVTPALFLDCVLAIEYAARHRGQVVPLFGPQPVKEH